MAYSFRITPNKGISGDTLTLEVQGILKASDYDGKDFVVKIFEVDRKQEKGTAGKTDDLLAEFDATIINTGTAAAPVLAFDGVHRADSNPDTLPAPDVRTSPEGDTFAHVPAWQTPHFILKFKLAGGPSSPNRILIPGGEREGYDFEIGFKVFLGKKAVFDSTKSPMILDCTALLAHNCVEAATMYIEHHQEMITKRGVGLVYGSQCEEPTLAADQSSYDLESTSCIDYQLDAVELGHQKSMAAADWKAIKARMKDGKGTELMKGFAKAGWIGLYYNPDVNNPADRAGEHTYSYSVAKKKKTYYDLKVTDFIINYRPNDKYEDGVAIPVADRTAKDTTGTAKLRGIPFGVLVARGGKHTAIVMSGKVYEAHWESDARDMYLYGTKDFELEWDWFSGMIMVPPGFW